MAELPAHASTRRTHYPCYKPRLNIRIVLLLMFLITDFCLYVVEGARCVFLINSVNEDPQLPGAGIDTEQLCWYDANWGNLRPVLIVSFAVLWCLIEFITMCINKKGLHPGIHIAFDLLFAIALVAHSINAFRNVAWLDNNFGLSLGRFTAAAVFALLSAILFLILFIFDCISVHRLRMRRYRRSLEHGQLVEPEPLIEPKPVAEPEPEPVIAEK